MGLINDTLDFQRIESGRMILEPEIIQTKEFINSVVEMISSQAKRKGIDFQLVNIGCDFDKYIKIDPVRMKQVLVNLLSNALKFTPSGGAVALELELIERKKGMIKERIRVKDTGIGISKEFMEKKLFLPFSLEFTDYHTGFRSFARYAVVSLKEGSELKDYIVMAVFRSATFIDRININGGQKDMSNVLVNQDGSYILRNTEFQSDNLFKDLYVNNNLSLDEMKQVKRRVKAQDGGVLTYKNSKNQDCVYVYSKVMNTDWNCISCVPLDSFRSKKPDFSFTTILVLLLGLMMIVDFRYLMEMNGQLKESAKAANSANEAKTDFLSRMSHDIRTPINVITGMTELAFEEEHTEKMEGYLENIKSSGKFLLGLVNDTLDMNKVESGKMELHLKPYAYSEFIAYLNGVIRPLCEEKNITFTINQKKESYCFITDPLRFNQIFFNLLSNAIKFTPNGGHVSCIEQIRKMDSNRISMDMEVKDDGIGMSEEFQKNMYNAFSQEDNTEDLNRNGTGLGLAIVKNLVTLMNGSIQVKSELEKGTIFYLHFEFELAKEKVVEEEKEENRIDLAGKRILLCEDHPLNTEIIVQLLGHHSITVESAVDGEQGLALFKASPVGYYDAVLMDIRMPKMNGIEATKAIRVLEDKEDAKTIPIIALTANAYDSDVNECMEAGMNGHLAKPIEPKKLLEMLEKKIRNRK